MAGASVVGDWVAAGSVVGTVVVVAGDIVVGPAVVDTTVEVVVDATVGPSDPQAARTTSRSVPSQGR